MWQGTLSLIMFHGVSWVLNQRGYSYDMSDGRNRMCVRNFESDYLEAHVHDGRSTLKLILYK